MKLLSLCAVFFWFTLVVTVSSATEVSPRLLIHLLDYVALDYSAAVDDHGKILQAGEFAEMKEFASTIVEGAKSLDISIVDASLLAGLEQLQKKIFARATPAEVARTARAAQTQLLAKANIEMAPGRWPDRAEGAALFTASCVQCHGGEGRGDGPSAEGLDPKPSNFHDGERMVDISPFQAFNAIRLGVPGTAMASFADLSDQQAWALAFYVVSLRHREVARVSGGSDTWQTTLEQTASRSDRALLASASEPRETAKMNLARLRVRSGAVTGGAAYVRLARERLQEALSLSAAGNFEAAAQSAILAYLDGVEPIEPALRTKDNRMVSQLEEAMLGVRHAIAERTALTTIESKISAAQRTLDQAVLVLEAKTLSPAFTFSVAFGIFLREGFEAILIIVTLLGIIRSVGAQRAARYVHAGWLLALVVGVVLWFFSGWVVAMSSISREIMEGAISLFAVVVLLYFGFWLHRKVQIDRWRAFLDSMTRTAVEGKKLFGLGVVAFMAVFREAFEIILFLRALSIEPGTSQRALWAGVGASFLLIFILAIALVRYSVKIPVRQLFSLSSWIVWLLAFVMSGKAVHSFQESGWFSASLLPWNFRWELVGLYPTLETLAAQIVVLLAGGILYYFGRRTQAILGR